MAAAEIFAEQRPFYVSLGYSKREAFFDDIKVGV
jgi:hypothetical protein